MNLFPRCRAYWLDSRLRGNDGRINSYTVSATSSSDRIADTSSGTAFRLAW
jgi:hypothetical protein